MTHSQSLEPLISTYGRLYLRMHRLFDRRMAASGASLARTKMMMFIDREGPVRAADIAELFSLAPRTVTEALDSMERAGLVERSPDPQDRRAKRVTITDVGKSAIAASEPERLALIEEVFGILTVEERAQFLGVMDKLSSRVGQIEDGVVRER